MKDFLSRVRYLVQFFPFRINFFVLCIVLFGIKLWIQHTKTETSSFYEILIVMAKMAALLIVFSIIVSFLSAFISWIYFLIQNPKYSENSILLVQRFDSEGNYIHTETDIKKAIRPFLGFVKMKLLYGDTNQTPKYDISFKSTKSWIPFKKGLLGKNVLRFNDVRTYHFTKGVIFFEDLLRLFSFAYPCSLNEEIANLPTSLLKEAIDTSPKQTKQDTVKIEQLRRIQGDYTNYKNFESNDDVRRIVWKIFAKNKELVVRTPEQMDRYSSHVLMFSTFYVKPSFLLFQKYTNAMLNRYKDVTWTIYKALLDKQFEVKLDLDQELRVRNEDDSSIQSLIASLNWQTENKASSVFKPLQGSVLCIHSMSSLEDIKDILDHTDHGTHLFFIKLSSTFRSLYLLNWLSYLFFKPKADELSDLRRKWVLSPLKYKLLKNEEDLITLLKKSNLDFEVI